MMLRLPLIPGWSPIRVPCISNKEFRKKLRRTKKMKEEKFHKDFYVAGVKFHKFNTVKDILEEGMELTLIPESTNKFDKHAIMIKHNNVMLGYMPMKKDLSKEVSETIALGTELKATITELAPDFEPWKALKVEVKEI